MSRAVIVWLPAALFFAYAFFLRMSPSVMASELMRDFQVGGALLGNLSAFYFYSYASLQILVGVLMDSYGPRRVLTVTALAAGLGTLLFALATSLHEAYAGRLLLGAGAGFGFVGALALIARWFPPRRFALMAGMTTGVAMLGAMGGQAPLALIVENFGWRGPMLCTAAFGVALSALCWLLIRDRPPAAKDAPARPQQKLLHSLGLASRNRQTWPIALFTGAQIAPFLSVTALWGVPYMMHVHGLERAHAALIASVATAGMALGAPFLGWLSDRIGRRKPVMYMTIAAQTASITAAFYWPDAPAAIMPVAFFILGFFSSCIVVGFATARESNDPEAVGAASGIVNTAVMTGGAILQPVIGILLDGAWTGTIDHGVRIYHKPAYDGAFLTLYGALAVALVSVMLIRETFCGGKREKI